MFQFEDEGGRRNFGPAITALYDCHLIPNVVRNDKIIPRVLRDAILHFVQDYNVVRGCCAGGPQG